MSKGMQMIAWRALLQITTKINIALLTNLNYTIVIKKSLVWQIIAAFVLAVIAGIIFGDKIAIVAPLGDLFLRLIKFIIVPLILSTVIVGVASTNDVQKLGRLGGKTIAYYICTS